MGLIDTVTLRVERFNDDMNKEEMSIDDLIKQECNYCYREVDASGLESFRCTNKTVNKETSWCRPKNANEPCSACEFCDIKDDKECLFYETCSSRTAICKVRQPDMGCPVYRYFKGLIVKDNEARVRADMVAILEELKKEIEEKSIIDYDEDLYDGGECVISISEINEIIQDKISALRGE